MQRRDGPRRLRDCDDDDDGGDGDSRLVLWVRVEWRLEFTVGGQFMWENKATDVQDSSLGPWIDLLID